jgi:ATP-binding cassette, subfamily B, multidrug efflux pump
VLIDKRDIRKHNLFQLRKNCGVVPQDVFLFSDTIGNNISFGSPEGKAGREQIEEAAKLAGVYDNIMSFPEKFETVVGERGVTLSGGQKQRISIARAMINRPRLLLLDDCLSAVDTETEEKILTNIQKAVSGNTSVIISHRISSIRHADLILYMKDGEIAEMGTHEELLAKKDHYFRLHQLQVN